MSKVKWTCPRTATCPGAGRSVCTGCARSCTAADDLAAQGYHLAAESRIRSWRDACANVAAINIEVLQCWKDLRRARAAREDA